MPGAKPFPQLENAKVTVMGLGRFGGGVGVTRWLVEQGARVHVTDRTGEDDLRDSVNAIQDLIDTGDVTTRLGDHDGADFIETDLVIVNPAVPQPWNNTYLKAAEHCRVPCLTEIELLTAALPRRDRVIGVTGSAGKSTTASLIAHMLRKTLPDEHRVFFGGNIGGTLLSELHEITEQDWVVLELSSAMLHWLSNQAWSPGIGVLTNITPNHLDWHGSLDHYIECKHHITRFQEDGDLLIRTAGPPNLPDTDPPCVCHTKVITTDDPPPRRQFAPLIGMHNHLNAGLAGLAAFEAFERTTGHEMPSEAYISAQRSFRGLPHRLEHLGVFRIGGDNAADGIGAINDSKCTTPVALALAVAAVRETFPTSRIHLIAGGYDKQVDLQPIGVAARDCATVAAIGAVGPTIVSTVTGHAPDCTILDAGTLEEAVAAIKPRLGAGDTILLSPGCASWDQFTNYEARGEAFLRALEAHFGPALDLTSTPE